MYVELSADWLGLLAGVWRLGLLAGEGESWERAPHGEWSPEEAALAGQVEAGGNTRGSGNGSITLLCLSEREVNGVMGVVGSMGDRDRGLGRG